jgi:hypothetical protein
MMMMMMMRIMMMMMMMMMRIMMMMMMMMMMMIWVNWVNWVNWVLSPVIAVDSRLYASVIIEEVAVVGGVVVKHADYVAEVEVLLVGNSVEAGSRVTVQRVANCH